MIFFRKFAERTAGFQGPFVPPFATRQKAYDPSISLRAEFQLEFPGAWPGGDVASVNSIFQGIKN